MVFYFLMLIFESDKRKKENDRLKLYQQRFIIIIIIIISMTIAHIFLFEIILLYLIYIAIHSQRSLKFVHRFKQDLQSLLTAAHEGIVIF